MADETVEDLRAIAEAVEAKGADASAVRALTRGPADYAQAQPVLSDLADDLIAAGSTSESAQVVAILQRLRITEAGPLGAGRQEDDAQPRELYSELEREYRQLFATCITRPDHAGLVAWHVRKLLAGQAAYERVGGRLGIPWYFVGIAHGLEASFRFDCHLHNGDPLSGRTVQVPAGRPPVWDPPNDWDSSAVDALTFEGFANQQDWGLPRTLYRWEAYNGFGSRRQGIHTPYLWSFSNHYTKGKYVADRKWDPNAVSKQCGAATMLKALVDGGHLPTPPGA